MTLYPDFPALYDPPQDIARRLREEADPTAELVYFGWGKWMLCRYNPRRDAIVKANRALVIGQRLLRRWETDQVMKANPGAFKRLYGRYLYWTLVRLGGQPTYLYADGTTKDGRVERWMIRHIGLTFIVDDARQMFWRHRTATPEEMGLELDRQLDVKEQQGGHMQDEAYHRDAARWLFTRTHSATQWDDPSKTRGPRSGFRRVMTAGKPHTSTGAV